MVLLEGISLSGEQVVGMTDKKVMVAKAPHYETFKQDKEPDKKKVVLALRLSDKNVLNYYPNKKSLKTLAAFYGFEMDAWIGKSFYLMTAKQNVQGNMKDVIYVDESKPHQ